MGGSSLTGKYSVCKTANRGSTPLPPTMMNMIEVNKRNGKFYAKLNFIGGIETYAESDEDLDVAVTEAVICFLKAAKEHGRGVVAEINSLQTIVICDCITMNKN